MTYKAQLVVRARSKEGAAIIEKVKEMASEQGATYSEMAVELLGRGLSAEDAVEAEFGVDEAADDEESSQLADEPSEPVEEAAQPTEPTPAPEPTPKASTHPRAPLPADEAGPPIDPELPAEKVVEAYMERREERGERAAARILVDFFAQAGPAEGGQIKKLLQKAFSEKDYEYLMEPIKETDEYSTYTERAIFGAPSPYSEVR